MRPALALGKLMLARLFGAPPIDASSAPHALEVYFWLEGTCATVYSAKQCERMSGA